MVAASDRQKVEDIIKACARLYVMPHFRQLKEEHISFKNDDPNNPVTIADEQSEIYLESKLTDLIRGSLVVGEENVEKTPEVLEYLRDPHNVVWVIDPIDGTRNFKDGDETFCIIVALVAHGETQLGWIYNPNTDTMAFAAKGEGFYINGEKVELDSTAKLEGGATGYTRSKYASKLEGVDVESLGCSGLEYVRIASGEALFSLYGYMKPWDHLAGTLMVQEAGGYVRKFMGSGYNPYDQKGGLISANSEDTWRTVKKHMDQVRSQSQPDNKPK
ncbi:MAG: inositol monophosphatase [Pseudomonadota bacterium]|nr:inositol monophosphatase [Pseudomonadota bacterium]MEC8665046.1 inositol monophosphatase [Pseudomonadota bacterium]